MISLKIFRRDGLVTGFEMSGHSGYAPAGRDIVCAAASSAAGMLLCAVTEVLSVPAEISADEENTFFSMTLPSGSTQICHAVTEAFYRHMRSLGDQYPRNIKISEVQQQ